MSDKPPDEKNGLLELFKKLWLPVAGFLSAVTLAYNFYQLWQGDQATITYFLAGGSLLVLVIVLAWVGFKFKIITSDPAHPFGRKKIERVPTFSSLYRQASQIGLLLIIVGFIIGGIALIKQRQIQEAKLVILIATFEGPEDVYGLHNEIVEKLNADFSENPDIVIVTLPSIVTPDQGSSVARALGIRHQADIVIWGWYRPTQNPNVTIHIENLNPSEIVLLETSTTLQPYVTMAELESFSFQQQAGQETSALFSFLIGYIQLKSGNYAQALLRFNDTLDKIPSEAVLLKNQSEIYYYRGNTHYFLDQYELAIADYSQAIQIDPQSVEFYNNRGVAYDALQQYEQAIADYSKAIEIDPQLAKMYSNRGQVYDELQQYERAIADYSKAIQIDPQGAESYSNRGHVYDELQQYEQAIADYSKAIHIDPQLETAYYNRGVAYYGLQQYEQAIADYSKAIQIDPQDAEAYSNRGVAYADQKQYGRAIADYSKAIQIDPQDAKTYNNRGVAYADQEQYEQAIADYSKAIQIDSQFIAAYYNRGHTYVDIQQYQLAIVDYSKAIQIDPQFIAAYFNRGIAYAGLQQYEQAITDFSKAIELDPQYVDAYYNRSFTYKLIGKTAEAEADFAKYKELTGKDTP